VCKAYVQHVSDSMWLSSPPRPGCPRCGVLLEPIAEVRAMFARVLFCFVWRGQGLLTKLALRRAVKDMWSLCRARACRTSAYARGKNYNMRGLQSGFRFWRRVSGGHPPVRWKVFGGRRGPCWKCVRLGSLCWQVVGKSCVRGMLPDDGWKCVRPGAR